jgi:REP element-mobilizing transposase RayT
MPRQARIDAPGALHHIIIRGIEKKAVFRDDRDRDRFVERLGRVLSDTATPCYAWSLMTNHVHLLLMTGMSPIATVMRRLLTGYAQDFNRRHNRHGQLFQNRYKSILCEKDPYLLELVRYIHLNPLRAGIVRSLDELKPYRYSGHGVLMGSFEYTWQETREVLGLFAKTVKEGQRRYRSFVADGIELGRRPELVGGGLIRSAGGWEALKKRRRQDARIKGDERILGGGDFVEAVLHQAEETLRQKARIRKQGLAIGELVSRVAAYYGVDSEDIGSGSRQRTIAMVRSTVCYLAVRKLDMSCTDVAAELRISPSAVSNAVVRGKLIVQKERDLENKIISLS